MRDDERIAGRSEERDELDRRIDAALRSYAEPPETTEPRVALARVMEQARAQRPARGIRWWMWSAAGAAACLLAVAIAMWMMRAPQVPEIARAPQVPGAVTVPEHSAPASAARTAVQEVRRTMHTGHSLARTKLMAKTTPLPKLEVFPTPTPLSPQEQALADFAKYGPPAVRHAVIEDQKHWDDPIIVADLRNRSPESGSQPDR